MRRRVHRHASDRVKRVRIGALVLVVLAFVGFTALGLARGDTHHDTMRSVVVTAPSTTVPVTVPPTTVPATTTTTVAPAMAPTTHPITVAGGTFTVVNGLVTLTYVVAPGDNLSKIAGWFDVMMGWQSVFDLNRMVVGNNPSLIFAGERLIITLPASVIPHVSPMYLADAVR